MADESIREVIVSAVSDALNRSQALNQEQSDGKVGKKRKAKILPSSFLKKGKAFAYQKATSAIRNSSLFPEGRTVWNLLRWA